MTRHGPFKHVYYEGMPPQLFDLARDPQERHDLAPTPAMPACSAIARPTCAAS